MNPASSSPPSGWPPGDPRRPPAASSTPSVGRRHPRRARLEPTLSRGLRRHALITTTPPFDTAVRGVPCRRWGMSALRRSAVSNAGRSERDLSRVGGKGKLVSVLTVVIFSTIQATLLAVALLGIAARRQRELADPELHSVRRAVGCGLDQLSRHRAMATRYNRTNLSHRGGLSPALPKSAPARSHARI